MGSANIYLLVIITTVFWGANFVLGGFVLYDESPFWAAAMRFVLGTLLMFGIAAWRRERLVEPLRKNAGAYLLLGVAGIVAFNLFFFEALRYTSANNAALIMATNPLLTTLLAAAMLGERPGARYFVALPIALAGVAVVVTHGQVSSLLGLHFSTGDLLMLGANLSWAFYNVLCRRYMPAGSPLVNTAWIMAAGAVVLFAIALGSSTPLVLLGTKAALSMAMIIVGGTVLAYLFWSMGIGRLGAARTAIFLNLVPVFAMLLGILINTPPTTAQLFGGLLVLGSVSVTMLPLRRPVAA